MNLPNHLKEKLGFFVIQERLLAHCTSSPGRELASKAKFSNNPELVSTWLNQTAEFLQLINEGNSPPLTGINDISSLLELSVIEGNWLSAEDLFKVYSNILTTRLVTEFIFEFTDQDSALQSFRIQFPALQPLELKLQQSVDEEGKVLDTASSSLRAIRRKIQSEEGVLRKKVNSIID